ncbi:MAG: pseudouridine synthase [Gammaproteobacteria bacterium]|nr:pseudouridine synthase [Gammaproteobacteria bacterium]MDH4313711.1 pseudouridine synthase [Gammaproteobacteria bacterium]MDH5212955.1 pseudouridine synthase [Gammaproteobacteria bacterium]MDH5500528.1 pseudouridine synthase [Gammaproteobacteria bacterium]
MSRVPARAIVATGPILRPVPLILLNKPFRVLSQFRDDNGRETLASYIREKDVYPAGRLDLDSEGLLLLTDDGALQARISEPGSKLAKTYRVQVEGLATSRQLDSLCRGVQLKDGPASALTARIVDEPSVLWPRDPPIRFRADIPTSWLELAIDEGRNRQVRRMTAAVGLPTLRLIRVRIGPWTLDSLAPGQSASISNEMAWQKLKDWSQETL